MTNLIKRCILQDLESLTDFAGRQEQLKKAKIALAYRLRTEIVGEEILQFMAKHPSAFETQSRIRVRLQGKGKGGDFVFDFDKPERMPANACNRYVSLNTDHPLSAEIHKHNTAEQKLADEHDRAYTSTKALLGSVSSVEALIKAWPEVKAVAEKYIQEKAVSKSTALAFPIQQLNETFKLPPK